MNFKFLQLCLTLNQKAIAGAVTFGVISIVATRGRCVPWFRACIDVKELLLPVAFKITIYRHNSVSFEVFFN